MVKKENQRRLQCIGDVPGIKQTTTDQSLQRKDISMIFCHADVQGAFMNDGMKCREGIEVSQFPANIPIYSGHFHKPHTVGRNPRLSITII